MPQLPTSAQAGVPGFEVNAWNGVLAPAKTPPPIIARLYEATVKLSSRADYEKDLEARGVEKLVLGPKEFTTYIRAESEKWRKVVAAGKARGG
jgi:tripartite-type tricarboxylate transporter receptor subunit TctC